MVVPPVSSLCMDAGMTSLAQCYEVVPCMGSTFRQRQFVVNFLNRHVPPGKQTQFTKRMRLYITVTDLLPGPSVSFLMGWVPLVSVVPLVLEPFMLRTILLFGKAGTSRISTGFLWFSWHVSPPSFGKQKSPPVFKLMSLFVSLL